MNMDFFFWLNLIYDLITSPCSLSHISNFLEHWLKEVMMMKLVKEKESNGGGEVVWMIAVLHSSFCWRNWVKERWGPRNLRITNSSLLNFMYCIFYLYLYLYFHCHTLQVLGLTLSTFWGKINYNNVRRFDFIYLFGKITM